VQDRIKSAELLDRSLNELRSSTARDHPLARLMKEILPALHEIGAARARGDKATVAKASAPVRKRIKGAISDPTLAPFLTEFGFYELMFINDDYSIGLTEKALSDARALLGRMSHSKQQDLNKFRTDELLIAVRAFIARAEDGKITDQVAYSQTDDEQRLKAWRTNHTLIDRLRQFNEELINNNFLAAEASLEKIRDQYRTLVRNGDAVSSFSFETFLQLRSRLVAEKQTGADFETINRTIIEGDIHLVVTSIIGNLFSAEARTADQRAWALNFENLSPRISVFFSKLYINSVHQNLNNLDVKLGANKHRYIKERSDFIRRFASQMIESGDFGQAFNALSIIEDIDHRNFLGIARLDSQRRFLVFDQAESNLLDFMERKTVELSILVREVLSRGQGISSRSLVNKVNEIEKELVLRFRTFSNLSRENRVPLESAQNDRKARARLAIIAHDSYVEIFGQYGSRTSVRRIGLSLQELRAITFQAYLFFSRPASDATETPLARVGGLEQSVSMVLDELGVQSGVPVYITADDALSFLPAHAFVSEEKRFRHPFLRGDRKSTRLNSSHHVVLL
jgi:hypothetical protein